MILNRSRQLLRRAQQHPAALVFVVHGVLALLLWAALYVASPEELTSRFAQHFVFLTVAYALVSILLAMALRWQVILPLRRLRDASRRIRGGQLQTSLRIDSAVADIQGLAGDIQHFRGELEHQSAVLEHQALHDVVTGLPNRTLLDESLRHEIKRARRDETPFALLLMDVDRFRWVNDTLGHQAGDAVLRQVAARMRESLGETETVARMGGDEFAVLLPGAGVRQAEAFARQLVRIMEKPFELGNKPLHLGGSVGVAIYPEHETDPVGLIRQADVAMYTAKQAGTGFAVFDAGQDQRSVMKMTLGNDLFKAVEGRELVVFYQPVVNLVTGRVCGAEALVHWAHPVKGILPPSRFIQLAEERGLSIPLTERVLSLVARDWTAGRNNAPGLRVSVNLSAQVLIDKQLPRRVEGLLRHTRFDAGQLNLELTESAILHDPEQARRNLQALGKMGVGLIIDDFGTGYSSLVHLKQLPVAEIKIDKSFVTGMANNKPDQDIVRATIRMAHDLGLRVTAEGVEDREVVRQLQEMGCDKVQGYYLAPAISHGEFVRWWRQFPGLGRWEPARHRVKLRAVAVGATETGYPEPGRLPPGVVRMPAGNDAGTNGHS